ncbi:response regulator [Singulisphaera sp. PoT]|uniref:response regulator n=1 Tax=Singulisphaera sp. PoT TaxID=3411797 RepID=UPI003BF5903D
MDDNVQAAESLAMIVRLWGHESLMAYDGLRALELANSYHPHVALVDISLPGMDGFTLARRLRDSLDSDDLMIMAITGYGRDHEPQKSEEAGFDDHLIKPLDLERLESRLLEFSNRRASRNADGVPADGQTDHRP